VIDVKTAEIFLNERVKITTERNYLYHGRLLQITKTALIIEDRISGKTCISLDDIKAIEEWG